MVLSFSRQGADGCEPKNLHYADRHAVCRCGDSASSPDCLGVAGRDRRVEYSVLGELAWHSCGGCARIFRLFAEAIAPVCHQLPRYAHYNARSGNCGEYRLNPAHPPAGRTYGRERRLAQGAARMIMFTDRNRALGFGREVCIWGHGDGTGGRQVSGTAVRRRPRQDFQRQREALVADVAVRCRTFLRSRNCTSPRSPRRRGCVTPATASATWKPDAATCRRSCFCMASARTRCTGVISWPGLPGGFTSLRGTPRATCSATICGPIRRAAKITPTRSTTS